MGLASKLWWKIQLCLRDPVSFTLLPTLAKEELFWKFMALSEAWSGCSWYLPLSFPQNEQAFEEVFQNANFNTYEFRIRVKLETYNVSNPPPPPKANNAARGFCRLTCLRWRWLPPLRGEKFPKILAHSKYCQSWALKEGSTVTNTAPSQVHQTWLVLNENKVGARGVVFVLPANPGTKSHTWLGQKEVRTKCLECSEFFSMPYFSFTGWISYQSYSNGCQTCELQRLLQETDCQHQEKCSAMVRRLVLSEARASRKSSIDDIPPTFSPLCVWQFGISYTVHGSAV